MGATTLEDQALLQFDRLLKRGELLWNETQPRMIKGDPFDFEFRVASALQNKPQDREQSTSTSSGAFPDSDGDWILPINKSDKSPHMKLILNKFCVMRPQFVLPTLEFQPQSDPLNAQDFQSGWDVLTQLPNNKYMMIFNCGIDAGSSVGHKHLQIIPQPLPNERGFFELLKPDQNRKVEEGIHTVQGAPFKHAAYPLPQDQAIHGSQLEEIYTSLFKLLQFPQDQPHNVLLTKQYLLLIPRRKAWIEVGGEGEDEGKGTKISGNAAAMVGLMYSWSEEQFGAYLEFGAMRALGEFGVRW